jgi:hypothetical protein
MMRRENCATNGEAAPYFLFYLMKGRVLPIKKRPHRILDAAVPLYALLPVSSLPAGKNVNCIKSLDPDAIQ